MSKQIRISRQTRKNWLIDAAVFLGGELKGAAPCKESEEHGHGDVAAAIEGGEYKKDKLGRLKEEAEMLRQQLEEVEGRLAGME